jgi:hypothetical protein
VSYHLCRLNELSRLTSKTAMFSWINRVLSPRSRNAAVDSARERERERESDRESERERERERARVASQKHDMLWSGACARLWSGACARRLDYTRLGSGMPFTTTGCESLAQVASSVLSDTSSFHPRTASTHSQYTLVGRTPVKASTGLIGRRET